MSKAAAEHYASDFHQGPALPGARTPWLNTLRCEALSRFAATGFPTRRQEDWKYTQVTAIEKRPFLRANEPAASVPDIDIKALSACPGAAARLVFLDGNLAPELCRTESLPETLRVQSLASVLRDEPDRLKTDLHGFSAQAANGFSLLNAAFCGQGALVEVAAGANLSTPVELMFLCTGAHENVVAHPQLWLRAGEAAQCTIVETFCALKDAPYLTNTVTRADLQEGAQLTHIKLQAEGDSAYHVANLAVNVAARARFQSISLSIGARLARNDIDVKLQGAGAHATLDGLMLGNGRQHTDFHTRVDHLVPDASSDEYYKGIFDGRSRGVFNGRVYVHPGADRTEAYQQNRNLLLSRNAEVDTKPQLEIYADEVKCSHGATVGQLDETMLFYLRSRGLSEETARGLLIFGFVREILDRVADRGIRTRLVEEVARCLPGSANLEGSIDE